ncbi:MAG TPA: hypothetical protein VF529_12675 [Solirubrobacteraceae bacterium]
MPRQILTLELDGLTAGDYIAHVCDPEPPALGHGLRSMTLRAEPLGATVEAMLVWDEPVPSARVAAQAAGLPLVAEVVKVDATEIHDLPRPGERREARTPARRFSALTERAAQRLAAQARPGTFAPQVLRWA